ncbi:MAG: SDR family NAD(P)-dependent oxidoreductase, partial [Tepidiformaceae bacterium]
MGRATVVAQLNELDRRPAACRISPGAVDLAESPDEGSTMARISQLSRSVSGKVVLVTGAGSGMGEATAYVFSDEGAKVAAVDQNREPVERVANAITAAGNTARGWPCDVSDRDAVNRLVAEVVDAFGGLDVLVNNAGISAAVPLEGDGYDEAWARVLAVNLTAMTYTIRAALPHLRKSQSPRIINIASTEGLGASPGLSPYTTAKHGVIGLTRSLAMEFGKEGITVNCICPGPIRTGMTESIPEESKEKYAHQRTALRRYGTPEEVAQMTLSFALPAASFLTGVAVPV